LYNQEYYILVDSSVVVVVVVVVYMIINTMRKVTPQTKENERRGFILEITIKKGRKLI